MGTVSYIATLFSYSGRHLAYGIISEKKLGSIPKKVI